MLNEDEESELFRPPVPIGGVTFPELYCCSNEEGGICSGSVGGKDAVFMTWSVRHGVSAFCEPSE